MVLLKMCLGQFSYPLLDLCLVKLFPVFLNGLWSCAKFVFPTLGENWTITLNYLLNFSSARHACHPSLCNKEDHREIEKIAEVKGGRVSFIPLPSLGISGRDSCKGGRIVTAQIWYPKIWAKFSLFALHCIMASIFKLLHMK